MTKPDCLLPPDLDIREYLESLNSGERRLAIERMCETERDAIDREWGCWAHDGQLAPEGDWSTWVIKAGRGFGKTRAGAEWVTAMVRAHEAAAPRIALVANSIEEARLLMVEGRSGLLAVAGNWVDDWSPSTRRLRFVTGAEAMLFSGCSPDMLRGPEHHSAWCDELAKWEKPRETWDMLQLGLRLGSRPRAVVTTTPRSGPVLQAIMDEPGTKVTGGPTRANPHLPGTWKARVHRLYAGTRLGRQELEGEQLPDVAGALWTVELLERCRTGPLRQPVSPSATSPANGGGSDAHNSSPVYGGGAAEGGGGGSSFTRTLIAVDPPVRDGTCGIIACAREGEGDTAIAHVLADHSVTARRPEGWASAVAAAAEAHGTIEVVAEANQGGRMVQAVSTPPTQTCASAWSTPA